MEKIRPPEINIDRDLLAEIMRNLEKLESSTDLEGSAIVSKTGLRIASSENFKTWLSIAYKFPFNNNFNKFAKW